MNVLTELQNWYQYYCDGTWEHSFGIKIDTLDNPGWTIIIDLEETALENKLFLVLKDDKSEDDWIICQVKEKKFFGVGDPQKLEKIVGIFLEWVKN